MQLIHALSIHALWQGAPFSVYSKISVFRHVCESLSTLGYARLYQLPRVNLGAGVQHCCIGHMQRASCCDITASRHDFYFQYKTGYISFKVKVACLSYLLRINLQTCIGVGVQLHESHATEIAEKKGGGNAGVG